MTQTMVATTNEPTSKVSSSLRSRAFVVIRWLWVTLSIVVLLYGQAIYDGKPNKEPRASRRSCG